MAIKYRLSGISITLVPFGRSVKILVVDTFVTFDVFVSTGVVEGGKVGTVSNVVVRFVVGAVVVGGSVVVGVVEVEVEDNVAVALRNPVLGNKLGAVLYDKEPLP